MTGDTDHTSTLYRRILTTPLPDGDTLGLCGDFAFGETTCAD
jgi:hypothetical protein